MGGKMLEHSSLNNKNLYLSHFFIIICFSLFCLFITDTAGAWDGTNRFGHSIEIESGNLVRGGNDIEIYNWDTGRYEDVEVESINRFGGSVEIEVYNWNTGEYDTLEMD